MTPAARSNASTNVVLPAPEWPTNTTLRIRSGWSTTGTLPAAAADPLDALSAMGSSFARGRLFDSAPRGSPPTSTSPKTSPAAAGRAAAAGEGLAGAGPEAGGGPRAATAAGAGERRCRRGRGAGGGSGGRSRALRARPAYYPPVRFAVSTGRRQDAVRRPGRPIP